MLQVNQIQKSKKSYRVKRPTQTGFSSPATHYNEPRIDLNDVLIKNSSSTFFVRVGDANFIDYNINVDDVLIVDRSLVPQPGQLALVTTNNGFEILRFSLNGEEEMQLWGVITYIIHATL
ncbi:S24 family peptidase [Winogradskyella maritima]|uniref:S24 family peptidase n=1 Tax=Winogradskyella maritima TaxID=1517766 RepID=A0ABV8AIH1_9FLAO|nr:S24 family peptidase [Winogradskyella maritima]